MRRAIVILAEQVGGRESLWLPSSGCKRARERRLPAARAIVPPRTRRSSKPGHFRRSWWRPSGKPDVPLTWPSTTWTRLWPSARDLRDRAAPRECVRQSSLGAGGGGVEACRLPQAEAALSQV